MGFATPCAAGLTGMRNLPRSEDQGRPNFTLKLPGFFLALSETKSTLTIGSAIKPNRALIAHVSIPPLEIPRQQLTQRQITRLTACSALLMGAESPSIQTKGNEMLENPSKGWGFYHMGFRASSLIRWKAKAALGHLLGRVFINSRHPKARATLKRRYYQLALPRPRPRVR